MRGRSDERTSHPQGNRGIGNEFDTIAKVIVKNAHLSNLLVKSNFRGSITIHVEPVKNSIKEIQFSYIYRI